MVNQAPIDATFAALADPTRRAMLCRLRDGDATVSELASPHAISMPAVLKHLGKLEAAGLVQRRKSGRVVTCSLNIDPLTDAMQWLNENVAAWEARLDALEVYLEQNEAPPHDRNDL